MEVDRRVGEPLRFVGPHTIGDFIGDAISGMDFFEFVVLNTRIEIGIGGDPDVAAARMYMQELRHETDSGRFTIVYGVYHDRLARRGRPLVVRAPALPHAHAERGGRRRVGRVRVPAPSPARTAVIGQL